MEVKGSKELFNEVIDEGLCTFCGGCSGGCPYLVSYRGRIVPLDNCTLSEGQCYQYCPRTYTDMNAVSQKIFGVPFGGDEMGIMREVFLARSRDAKIREKGQGGLVVTTLLSVALTEGIIDAAIVTKMSGDKTPVGLLARNKEELLQCTGTGYETARVLEALNRIPKESNEKLGVIGLPCQVASLSKRKVFPPQDRVNIDNVKLVLGLFCAAKKVIESGETREYVNRACSYCWDRTAEFADISVGSGRAKFKDWNIVIVRTKTGAELMDTAKAKRAVETQPIPGASLIIEKKAALDNKKRALSNIIAKTGDKKNLLYLGLPETIVDKLLT